MKIHNYVGGEGSEKRQKIMIQKGGIIKGKWTIRTPWDLARRLCPVHSPFPHAARSSGLAPDSQIFLSCSHYCCLHRHCRCCLFLPVHLPSSLVAPRTLAKTAKPKTTLKKKHKTKQNPGRGITRLVRRWRARPATRKCELRDSVNIDTSNTHCGSEIPCLGAPFGREAENGMSSS